MRRRAVLGAAGLALGPGPEPEAGLLGLFAEPEAARALGQLALAGMPGVEAGALAAALWRELEGTGPLRRRAAAAAQRDFMAGRVTCVDGWMLAAVEARLCALMALSAAAGG